jgi:hypothetical protein
MLWLRMFCSLYGTIDIRARKYYMMYAYTYKDKDKMSLQETALQQKIR